MALLVCFNAVLLNCYLKGTEATDWTLQSYNINLISLKTTPPNTSKEAILLVPGTADEALIIKVSKYYTNALLQSRTS